MRIWLTLCTFLLIAFQSQAALYKWVNKDGETVYSDTPPNEQVEEIKLPELSVTPAVKYKPKPKSEPTAEPETTTVNYSDFKILQPVKDAIIHNNAGSISINLSLKPKLDNKAGHSINILVDGQVKIRNHTQLSAQLTNIDRGSHTLSAQIVDKQGKILASSNSASFTIYRYSKLHK